MSNFRKSLCLILAALMVSSAMFTSCAENADENVSDDSANVDVATEEETEAETEAVYPSEIGDYEGYEFTFYNQADDFWAGSHHVLDYEEVTGDSVEDAVYARNRKAENELNISINVVKEEVTEMYGVVNKTVAAGEDVYDVVYLPLNWSNNTSFGADWVVNLKDVSTFNFDQPWWNQEFIDKATIGDKLYTSIDYVCLMGYCYSNVLFFNKDMLTDYSLDQPYDLVREGNWTYDTMQEYMKAVMSIGTQSKWTNSIDGDETYGLACQHEEAQITLLQGCGSYLIVKDEENKPMLREDLNTIVDAFDKLTGILSEDGAVIMHNTADFTGGMVFLQGRALFYQGSLGSSTSTSFRQSDFEYGILPAPKYDESQSSYFTNVSQYTFALNIPIVASDPERTGAIIDYLTFLSYNDVVPVLKEALCYKGMRDEDSIDMLDILMETETLDLGVCSGLTFNFLTSAVGKMMDGNSEFMSLYEKNSKSIQRSIDKLFDAE